MLGIGSERGSCDSEWVVFVSEAVRMKLKDPVASGVPINKYARIVDSVHYSGMVYLSNQAELNLTICGVTPSGSNVYSNTIRAINI